MLEKTLDEILGVGRRIAAPPNECVERRPIRFAKSGERFPRRFVGVALARLQNDRPMRRLEWRTALLQRPWNRFRRLVIISCPKAFYDKKQSCLKRKLGIPADIDVLHVLRLHDASRCHSLTRRGNERD